MINLTLTNTLSGKKEQFISQQKNIVSLYVCGITPYDYAHLGHGRCYVTFDLLVRTLRFLNYKVTYIRNYTDIDDKILKKAHDLDKPYLQISDQFITSYQQNMQQLLCLPPDQEPRVTTHIQEIITFIKGLIASGNAYCLDNDVYFNVSTFASYGKLSKKNLDDLIMGSRVEVNENKKNPGDFALWKGNDKNLFWQSPWGYGRPGWHIECSAMAKKYCGATIDIHGGGADLIFPHHENEIAQSEALHNKPFVRYWLHNAFVTINKEKMSKSLGNSITLHNIFDNYDPIILRYFFIQHHYRTPIDFSFELLDHISTAYKKLVTFFSTIKPLTITPTDKDFHPIITEILQALSDDLNSTKMLGLIFQHLDSMRQNSNLKRQVLFLINTILGLPLQPIKEQTITITPEIQNLIDQREKARQEKDWKTSDQLRDKLQSLGICVQDKKA